VSTPLVDATTGLPVVAQDGVPIVCETGDCGCPPFECVCENTEGVTVGEWDDTDANPCNIVNCILDTYIWLLEIEIAWRDPETAGDCTIVDGTFVITPDNSSQVGPGRFGGPQLYSTAGSGSSCCGGPGADGFATPFNQFAHNCKVLCPTLAIEFDCDVVEDEPVVSVCVTLTDRTFFDPVCNDSHWWNACSVPTAITTLAPGHVFNLTLDGGVGYPLEVISGKITLLGQICGGDYEGDGEPDSPDEHCPSICAPALDFEITEIGNCVYSVTNLTTPGGCPIKLYVWSDGYVSELPERPNLTTNTGCGESDPDYRLTLWVIDDADCVHERSKAIPPCCKCEDADGNPCSAPAGTLSVTLVDADNCQYLLEADVPSGQEMVCGTGHFIEWRLSSDDCNIEEDCECFDIEAGNCGGTGCSGGLRDGQTFLLTIAESITLFWRVREDVCGCWGPWNEVELPCTPCECCDGKFGGMTMSFAGAFDCAENPGFGIDCACEALNGAAYTVPSTGNCTGQRTIEFPGLCTQDEAVFDGALLLGWRIECDEDGFWLYLEYSLQVGAAQSDASFQTLFLGEEMPDCDEIEGCFTATEIGSCIFCNAKSVTVCATGIAA
jgi:hypothetical protein